MQSDAKTITQYLAGQPESTQTTLRLLQAIIDNTLTEAVGSMRYGMPHYEFRGRFLAFNAQKNYFSFYADPAIVKLFRKQLSGSNCGKSCIRFKRLEPGLAETLQQITSMYRTPKQAE